LQGCQGARLALSLVHESGAGAALAFDGGQGGVGLATLGRLLDRGINLAKASVEVSNVVGLDVDPGRKGRVLGLDSRCRRAALAHMSRHKLGIHAGRVDDGYSPPQCH